MNRGAFIGGELGLLLGRRRIRRPRGVLHRVGIAVLELLVGAFAAFLDGEAEAWSANERIRAARAGVDCLMNLV
jgi:hypothetical protein